MFTALAKQAHHLKFLMNENSPALLTGVGVAGTIATAYLTGRATFKAAEIIGREQNALTLAARLETEDAIPPKLTKIDQVKLVWPHYILPASTGLMTVTAIIAAHKVSASRLAAMTMAAGVSERALQQYKEKVIEKLGERQDQKIRDEVAQDNVTRNPPNHEIVFAGTGEVICFDSLTGRYFQSTMEDIKRAENRLNREILHYNSASLTYFYDEIGLQPTDYTDSVGWSDHVEVQFSTTLTPKNQPCIVITFSRNPVPDYDRNWT